MLLIIGIALIASALGAMMFGEHAVATVLERVHDDPELSPDHRALVVEFRTRSGMLVRVTRVLTDDGKVYSPGDSVPVMYFPSHPEDAHLDVGWAEWASGGVLAHFGCAIVVASMARAG